MSLSIKIDWSRAREALLEPAHPALTAALGLFILAGLYGVQRKLDQRIGQERAWIAGLVRNLETLDAARERAVVLRDLKKTDVESFKAGFSGRALSNQTLYESGLSLQEERRLLDKQLEIMTTYLIVNPALQRVFIMRGDQPLQSFLISYIPLKIFGAETAVLPRVVRITSKERFAHPERGRSEMVNGKLQWTPPQVGTSVRSNALGEFVIFTNSRLILHGPPLNPADHEKFPHICLGLDRAAAQKLYRSSFIGTKIILSSVTAVPASAASPPEPAAAASAP